MTALPHSPLGSLVLPSVSPLGNASDLVPQTLLRLPSPAGNLSNKTGMAGTIAAAHQLNRGIRFDHHELIEAMCLHKQRTGQRGQCFTAIHHWSVYWLISGKSPHPPVTQLLNMKTGIASAPGIIH